MSFSIQDTHAGGGEHSTGPGRHLPGTETSDETLLNISNEDSTYQYRRLSWDHRQWCQFPHLSHILPPICWHMNLQDEFLPEGLIQFPKHNVLIVTENDLVSLAWPPAAVWERHSSLLHPISLLKTKTFFIVRKQISSFPSPSVLKEHWILKTFIGISLV